MKKKNRQLKLLLSIGGWTYSRNGNFASAAGSAQNRATFARTSVALMKDWGFESVPIAPFHQLIASNLVLLVQWY